MNRQDDEGWANLSWASDEVLYKNYGPAGYDRTHIFQLGSWPSFPSEGGSGAANAIIKNWSPQRSLQRLHRDPVHRQRLRGLGQHAGDAQTADLVGNIEKLGGSVPATPTMTPAPGADHRGALRQHGRNTVRGPGWWNIDLSIFRQFPIGKKLTLEARAEAFNLTNTPHFNNPNGNVNSGAFMDDHGHLGQLAERQFRLGVRLQF